MNILYIVDMLTVLGECEINTINLANEMSKTNKVIILTNHFNSDLSKLLGDIEVRVGFNDDNYRQLYSNNIEIVQSCPFTAVEIGYNLSKKFNAKHFITVYGTTAGITKDIVDNCEKVIFINEKMKEENKDLIPDNKGIIIPIAIDGTKFKEKIVRFKKIKNLIKPKYKTIVVSSALKNNNNPINQLLKISPILAKKLDGLNIIFVNRISIKDYELKEVVNNVKSDLVNINIAGQVEDVSNYLNIADLVLASDRCAIEAILCNKPVFYMDDSWQELIKKENYKELIFGEKVNKNYSDIEIINKLATALKEGKNLNQVIDLYLAFSKLCDSRIVAEKFESLYK